jgi:hypothetical protein
MSITRISNRKLDAISEWMIENDIPLTRENWISVNWMFEGKTEADLEGEEFCQIPRYLSNEDENGDPIPTGKKAKVLPIKAITKEHSL